ncbi:MAG: fibronectin type III domain-containing protein [Flavobacteriales bacterium]|nr:fibronectin type III domain-containing protein [Flavobacteriales bacterium]
MKLIKAGTSGLNAVSLIAKAEYVEGKMKTNLNFATPNPAITEVTAAREALVTAVAQAESRSFADLAVRNAQTVVLRTLLVNLARYVNNVALGDVDKAVSSGFEPAKKPEPSTHLDPPVKLEARVSDFEGSVDLLWKRVEDARMYQVYINDGDPSDATKWSMVAVSSRTRTRITDLVPGKFYSFRVTALGRIGEGPASDVVSGRAA